MTGGRILTRAVRRRGRPDVLRPEPGAPAVVWGRIGDFDAVSRGGVLFLLAREAVHPALRVSTLG